MTPILGLPVTILAGDFTRASRHGLSFTPLSTTASHCISLSAPPQCKPPVLGLPFVSLIKCLSVWDSILYSRGASRTCGCRRGLQQGSPFQGVAHADLPHQVSFHRILSPPCPDPNPFGFLIFSSVFVYLSLLLRS